MKLHELLGYTGDHSETLASGQVVVFTSHPNRYLGLVDYRLQSQNRDCVLLAPARMVQQWTPVPVMVRRLVEREQRLDDRTAWAEGVPA